MSTLTPSTPFELQSLAEAHNYQKWLIDLTMPYLGKRILELGSGIGNLSQHLPVRDRLILSDIDSSLVEILKNKLSAKDEKILITQLNSLQENFLRNENLDTVVSFNVLEHVENDSELLKDAIDLLKVSQATGPKRIVTIVPSHQWAYGRFDEAFCHYRRYNDATFRAALEKAGARPNQKNYYSRHLNIPALAGWWLNGKVLQKKEIGLNSIKAFDKLCPLFRPIDDFIHKIFRIPLGNSLLTVYSLE